ncbi:MAG: hypothetical protein JST42_26700 [Bacteroidetes bacterium]|nr:hypothetical protein [Bacteroidota bacterium]
MSKRIYVPCLSLPQGPPSGEKWSLLLDGLPRHLLDICPWPEFPLARPVTHFAVAHNKSAIYLKFFVDEVDPRITFTEHNDPVYKDSCVEFFLSLDKGASYYNMEWNAAGVCLMMYGRSRQGRTAVSPALIRSSDLGVQASGWSLALYIPVSVFGCDSGLSGMHATANFYKCGDECREPHYIVWNDIRTPAPDFHQPRYFGDLIFL